MKLKESNLAVGVGEVVVKRGKFAKRWAERRAADALMLTQVEVELSTSTAGRSVRLGPKWRYIVTLLVIRQSSIRMYTNYLEGIVRSLSSFVLLFKKVEIPRPLFSGSSEVMCFKHPEDAVLRAFENPSIWPPPNTIQVRNDFRPRFEHYGI
jgi:hypothetical protein